MLYGLKAWDVVAWTADADHWCEACLVATYGEAATIEDPLDRALDREGNPIHPVFASDLGDSDIVCGKCFGVIYREEN